LETHNRFRLAFAHAPIGTAFVGLDGRLLEVNQAFCRLTGYAEANLLGRFLDELRDPEDVAADPALMTQLLAGEVGSYQSEKHFVRADGTRISVMLSRSVLVDHAGRPELLVTHVSDITDQTRALRLAHAQLASSEARYRAVVTTAGDVVTEREATDDRRRLVARELATTNAETNAELSRSNSDLSDFASVAAHDLKSPLHVVLGFSKLLASTYGDRLDDEGRDLLGSIVGGAERMEELIEDLLLYCRLGAAELAIAPVDLNEVLAATLRILRPEIESHGAEVDAAVLPQVNGDSLQLQNLLENLVGNALKFSVEGTVPKVHVGAEWVDDGWCLSVSDNGIGIDPTKRDRIFGMFARLNPQDHYGGTGIGLTICKRIVERHGGRIAVEYNPGGGSRFLVSIPGSPQPTSTLATTADTAPAVVRLLEVLLVEDSAEHAKLIAALLSQAPNPGYRLHHVGSVASAVEALASTEVDCVLLDLSLPDAADLEAVALVTAAAPTVPIVVITSSSDDALAFAAVREGAQDYLVKGHIDVTQLSRSIGWAVHRKALETRLARDALHDALTGLPNRTLMIDRLRSALSRTERSGTKVAVFFMDLDDFKPINDRLGHDAGDKVLVVVADRLRDAVRPSDTVARIGGDEFVVIWEGIGDANQEWELLRTRLAATVAAPITLEGTTVQVTASIGLAVGGSEREPEALLREADLAMYQTKRSRL
ncbi:MAG: hypothetical protein QOK39_2521, partial [Acidimicrobiaceae bacterium]|nr:hypothetical protein [Acidimicrobiaceae bacterium]